MPHPSPTTLVNLLLRAGTWAKNRALRDHASLFGGWYQQNYSNRQHFYVSVACAPSRRFKKPRPVDPDTALAFLDKLTPGVFSFPATQSTGEVVAFEVMDPQQQSMADYESLHAARIWANGRVELFDRAPVELDANGRAVIDLAGAFVPLQRLAQAVRNGEYRRAYGLPTKRRRLDWFAAVGNTWSHPTRGSEDWVDLKFPGRRPRARATRHYAAAPIHGLGWPKTRSHSQSTDPSNLVRSAVTELISNSGWHDGNLEAVDDTVAAVTERA
jgi:hypothetical protein